jgi:hypothetical protein
MGSRKLHTDRLLNDLGGEADSASCSVSSVEWSCPGHFGFLMAISPTFRRFSDNGHFLVFGFLFRESAFLHSFFGIRAKDPNDLSVRAVGRIKWVICCIPHCNDKELSDLA